MNRRNVFKLLASLPFLKLSTKASTKTAETKMWLLTTKEVYHRMDVTFSKRVEKIDGVVLPLGEYKQFVARFDSAQSAHAFKQSLIPMNGPLTAKISHDPSDNIVYLRSGYRGAVRAIHNIGLPAVVKVDYWFLVMKTPTCYYQLFSDKMNFQTVHEAWTWINDLIIMEDDGTQICKEMLLQPFKCSPEVDVKYFD